MSERRKHRSKLASVYVWHRYIGVTVAVFVVLLAVTGILLNHADGLRLDKRHVRMPALLDWYGIRPPKAAGTFRAGERYVTLLGARMFVGETPLDGRFDVLHGVTAGDDVLVIAADQSLLLVAPDGSLIERLNAVDGVPAGLAAIGSDDADSVVVRGAHGSYTADPAFMRWERRPVEAPPVRWATEAPLPIALRDALGRHFVGSGLPVERVLLDLHSGRIFGLSGTWFSDIIAGLLIALALSGTWLWLRHRR